MSRRRDDRGAFAILFAVCAVVLFSVAALAVDLGNAYQRKREVQSQADFAALAGAAALPDQAAAIQAICESGFLNVKVGQGISGSDCAQDVQSSTYTPTATVPLPACPTNTGRKAHVFFFSDNEYKLKVCSPPATVNFGPAQGMPDTADSVDVVASATAVAGTPESGGALPFYGVTGGISGGCDWGYQGLTDPARGHAATGATLPSNLAQPSTTPTQSPTLTSVTPAQLAEGLTTATVRLNGNGLTKVTAVGFYRETTETPHRVEPGTLPSTSDSTGKYVDFTVPLSVLQSPGIWYVRTYETGSNAAQTGWSTTALVLRVGEAVITCPSLASSGNFGALKLPRTDSSDATSNGWMPNNIADGTQLPFSLAIHEEAADPWTCEVGGTGVVYSAVTGTPDPKPRTNCVTTDTGLTSVATTAGLITGTTVFPNGRLAGIPTSTGVLGSRNCGPARSGASRSVLGKSINNDTLTCFMTDPAMPISTIASATYTRPATAVAPLDPAIFNSPRYCYTPILRYDPAKGRSLKYSVVDMRPCFITGELNSSTWNSQVFAGSTGTNNGITLNATGSRVETLGVVFFNRAALPTAGGELGDYIGTAGGGSGGDKTVRLVD